MRGLKKELKGIMQRKKLMLALAGIMLMPLLYGGVLIWSFWDPYGQVEALPVAVVNEDKGTEVDGEQINAGDDFTKELAKSPELDFHFVDEETARQGMEEFDYYFLVSIPPSFSENVASVAGEEPVKGELYYEVNSDYNYVSSQIAANAVESMERELSEALTLAYAEVATDSFSSFTGLVRELEEGASDLKAGSTEARDGSEDLGAGLGRIEEGAGELTKGAGELEEGTRTFRSEWIGFTESLEVSGLEDTFLSVREHTVRAEEFLEDGQVSEAAGEFDRLAEKSKELEADAARVKEILEDTESLLDEAAAVHSEKTREWQELSEDVGPVLEEVLKKAETAEETAAGAGKQVAELEKILNRPLDILDDAENHYRELPDIAGDEWGENESVSSWYEEGLEKFERVPELQAEIDERFSETEEQYSRFQNAIDKVEEGAEAAEEKQSAAEDFFAAGGEYLDDVNEVIDELSAAADQVEEVLNAIEPADHLTGIQKKEEDLANHLHRINSTLDQAKTKYKDALEMEESVRGGLDDLVAGAARTKSGTADLEERIREAHESSFGLADGLDNLAEGTVSLHKNLDELASVMGNLDPERQHELMVSSPVKAKGGSGADYSYGEGLTPYFLSIGLYVGALTLSIIYPFRDPLGPHANGYEWFTGKLGVALLTGSAQVTILLAFLFFGLNLDIASPVSFIWFAYLVSAVFISLIFTLVGVLDNPGRFVAIILLILQLGGSGGTFPVELLASPLQTVHGWLPMTYSILGFRSVVFMDSPVFLFQSVTFLAGLGLLMLTGAFLFYRFTYKKLCLPMIHDDQEQTKTD
ncbi:YhgE/Pip domain-containing protein [Alteribacter natronophilus]|uniref:YhgE/Pip domain-containing protein n=1 Tax=Alteribacter natronophilus TaxID=2583810 RepID=UPI00110D866D|nr:YhgE/Pip domain-containing protein [Alteribacter natronophilus]TMW71477.1 YhgE/Pip domain-containing protein [Alteribacter natronophilus]